MKKFPELFSSKVGDKLAIQDFESALFETVAKENGYEVSAAIDQGHPWLTIYIVKSIPENKP